MEFKSLVAEFEKGRHAERVKPDNLEATYTAWAAHSAGAAHTTGSKAAAGDAHAHPISSAIGEIRSGIKAVLEKAPPCEASGDSANLTSRVHALENENKTIKAELNELRELVQKLQITVGKPAAAGGDAKTAQTTTKPTSKPDTKPKQADDEIDLFGSDDEEDDEEAAKIKEMRVKAYQEKKSKKPGVVAKSSVILDVKPWDDETDMADMEKQVRSIVMDGLLWGASKLVPVGFGIKKLQIMCVVEDEKVSVEELQEKIEAFEDFVQSVDIAAFNKI